MTDAHINGCAFCPKNGKVRFLAESRLGYAVAALNPPVEGCILLIPKDHIESYLELPSTWQVQEVTLLRQLVRAGLMETFSGYTPSWNLSAMTGRQIPHLHHWWIPRFGEDPDSIAYQHGAATLIGRARKTSALHAL